MRGQERNIIRNSGQYWKATGVLADTPKQTGILLTDFGNKIARGEINRTEFALTVIRTLELPNKYIEKPAVQAAWAAHGVEPFRPLLLIIKIVQELMRGTDAAAGYVTESELLNVVIPLSGHNTPVAEYARVIQAVRRGEVEIESVAYPETNDRRMAREFLLFLACYEVMTKQDGRYFLNIDLETGELLRIEPGATLDDAAGVAEEFRRYGLASTVEEQQAFARGRVQVSVADRRGQARFRQRVLGASERCVISGADLRNALEAAHIRPVKDGGTDDPGNGLCLRRDLHSLFDFNHLRLDAAGVLHKSAALQASVHYRALPERVGLPPSVNLANVEWRFRYYA